MKNRKLIVIMNEYDIECDGTWHYIVPADHGQETLEGMCNCDDQAR